MDVDTLLEQETRFKVDLLSAPTHSRAVPWLALHQDYSEDVVSLDLLGEVGDGTFDWFEQATINSLLNGGRGHFGPLEHTTFVFVFAFFPHVVINHLRTHRTGISFDVQSTRYTGQRVLDYLEDKRDFSDVFYIRPVGEYHDRKGKRYTYTEEMRAQDIQVVHQLAVLYRANIRIGMSEEHARYILPGYAMRQHFVMSANTRTLMHLFDLRLKPDAELETRAAVQLLFNVWKTQQPLLAEWYLNNRALKGRLAP